MASTVIPVNVQMHTWVPIVKRSMMHVHQTHAIILLPASQQVMEQDFTVNVYKVKVFQTAFL